MVDKIKKALDKFNNKKKEQIKKVLHDLKARNLSNYDIKKLKGRKDIFRIRKGKIRIIYRIDEGGGIYLLTIEKRSDTTYNL